MNHTYNQYGCNIKKQYGVKNMATRKRASTQKPRQTSSEDGIREAVCPVNYTKNGKTSVTYMGEGKTSCIFVDGEYSDSVVIKYKGEFSSANIVSVEQI